MHLDGVALRIACLFLLLSSAAAVVVGYCSVFQHGVRYNLDPFEERSDDEIWSALEKCHISETVSN